MKANHQICWQSVCAHRDTLSAIRFLAILGSPFLVACSNTDPAVVPPPDPRFETLANAIEAERASQGIPGVAVAVVERGKVTFARGFGTKDEDKTELVQPTTLFRIGSITKTLTSTAVLQTVESGCVDLDAAVTKYVPNFHMNSSPQRASAIKVRHLLTHTSGLEDTGIALDAPANEQADSGLEAFATGRFADLDTIAANPGVVYNYANANFMLAGLVAEKATATPYRLLMRDRLFAPLDMRRTFFLAEDVISDGDYAVGQNCVSAEDITCAPDLPEAIQPDSYDNPAARPAGYAWSSVLDLAKFTNLLVYGDPNVLSDDLRTQMISPQVSMRSLGDVSSYGFGTVVDSGIVVNSDYEPVKLVTHNGALAGYRSVFYCLPALEFCFIALANGASNDWPKSFITALETLTTLPAPAIFPDVSPQPSRFPAYAGTYRQGEFDDYEFTASDGNLYVEIPSFDAAGTAYDYLLQPTTVDNFVLQVGTDTLPLTFFADASGRYQYVVSQPYIAERVAP